MGYIAYLIYSGIREFAVSGISGRYGYSAAVNIHCLRRIALCNGDSP